MSSKRREYHVDHCSKKVALFFVACDANPYTRVKIPDAMRIKGYSPSEAANRSLQMQVRHEADKIKGEAIPGPPAPAAAAASALLQRKAEATGREKDKNSRVEYHARREAALPIVDRLKNELENDVGRLKSKELEVLLHKGCACVNDGERCEQTHPLPTICRVRCGGGGHRPDSVDGNR
jgi:hypothetical protein